MTVSAYIHRLLCDLLEENRVVVWYDADGALRELANRFKGPNCQLVDTSGSLLKSRRELDRIFRGINDPDDNKLKNQNLLVYCPRRRGQTDEQRCEDPFEVFAVCGVAFGDKPGESLQSLAKGAMPDRTAEIDRLFEEGRPTLSLLDNLKAGQSFPLVKDCLGTDSPLDAAAIVLCSKGAVARIADTPGVIDELLRLLHDEYGYSPPPRVTKVESKLETLGSFVLLSEFAFDTDDPLPDPLSQLPVAPELHKDRIFALCERMRKNDDFREGYIDLAERLEGQLRLRELFEDPEKLGQHDTFPFEERHYLSRLSKLVEAGKLAEAREVVDARRSSVWSSLGERAVLWKLAERCVEFLQAVESCRSRLVDASSPVADHITAYVERDHGLWRVDRSQRLVEQGAADCAEDDEIQPLIEVCRRRYAKLAGQAQERFLQAVRRDGWPPETVNRQTQTFDRHVAPGLQNGGKVAFFLTDSLRYEMGRDLGDSLKEAGAVSVEACVSILPTVTPFGMAALMPGADGTWKIVNKGSDLVPSVGDKPLPDSKGRIALLKNRFGDRYADATLEQVMSLNPKKPPKAIANAELLVVRTQEMDSYGEVMSLYQARKHMSGILGELVTATNRLAKLGYSTFVFAADHGHVLIPEVPAGDVVTKPAGEWSLKKRRSLMGHSTGSASGVVVMKTDKLGIEAPVPEMAVATGFCVFTSGAGYFHEGISLQECVLPVVVVNVSTPTTTGATGTQLSIRYRSDRFTSPIIGLRISFNSLLDEPIVIRLEAYDGAGTKAKVVGEAADCDARDPTTGLITLKRGQESQVPLRLEDDFEGKSIEVRAMDASGPGVVLARLQLKNAMMM
jgi:hypothetical protein